MSNRPRHYRKKIEYPPGRDKLHQIVTVSEAAALWRKHPNTIRMHIYAGNLEARMAGSQYLIATESLVAYYGHSPLIIRRKSVS